MHTDNFVSTYTLRTMYQEYRCCISKHKIYTL